MVDYDNYNYEQPHRKIYWDDHCHIIEEDELNKARKELKELIEKQEDGDFERYHPIADDIIADLLDEETRELYHEVRKWYA
jgi:hypothetical protein